MRRRLVTVSPLAVVALFLAIAVGCATLPPETDLKTSLLSTAQLYWKLRMADNYEETYAMEDEEGLPSLIKYLPKVQAIRKIQIRSQEVSQPVVEGTKGTVDLEFTFSLPNITKPMKQTLKDEWVYKKGKWRHRLPS